MKEMFEASVDGEAFDMDRWGQYFRPDGMRGNNNQSSTQVVRTAPVAMSASTISEDDGAPFNNAPAETPAISAPAASTTTGEAGSRAADIIAMIRKRQETK